MSNVIFNPSLLNWSSLILTVSHVFIYLFLRFIHLLNDLLILYPVIYFIYWFIYVPTLFIELAIYLLIYLWPFSIYQSITSKKKMTQKKKRSTATTWVSPPFTFSSTTEVPKKKQRSPCREPPMRCEKNCNHEGLKLRVFVDKRKSVFFWKIYLSMGVPCLATWWFHQPILKNMLVKMDHVPR